MKNHVLPQNYFLLFALLALLLLGSGCARKKIPAAPGAQQAEILADLKNFPQNLEVYAKLSHPHERLLSQADQEYLASRFLDIYFGPWSMRKTTVKKSEVAIFFKKARGYKKDGSLWNQHEWDALAQNANLAHFPSIAQPAITLRETDLRELPTHEARSDKPEKINTYPFDYFQYSRLAPGMPLLIAHATNDGKWVYAECPIASGWVDAKDVGYIDDEFKSAYRNNKFVALIKNNVSFKGQIANIGCVLPLQGKQPGGAFTVLAPAKNQNAKTAIATASIAADSAVEMPWQMTAENVAQVGNQFMGQKYGWGGTLGDRDCSATIRDLFTPFGIWLPRNSAAQARRGAVLSLEGLSPAAKKEKILALGMPFLSLLGLRGHIGLYVGEWKGEPALFHNVWGVRIVRDGNDDERFVIGKTVVSSLSPGKELQNLYLPLTFTDRIRTLTTLRGAAN